jgi:hypothetical protein
LATQPASILKQEPQTLGLVEVKRFTMFAVVAAGMCLVMWKMIGRAGPRMRAWCSEMCDRFLATMPESFPPNRMMSDLQALREQTDRILDVLEEREKADESQA